MICVSASRAKGKGKEYICIHIFRPPDRPPTDHRAQRGEEKLLSQKLGSPPETRSVGNFALFLGAARSHIAAGFPITGPRVEI